MFDKRVVILDARLSNRIKSLGLFFGYYLIIWVGKKPGAVASARTSTGSSRCWVFSYFSSIVYGVSLGWVKRVYSGSGRAATR